LARTWVETCLSRHGSTCGHRDNRRFLPTRLLEISDASDQDDLSVRLYLPSATDLELGLDYCTLSHCWGDINDVLCLTASALQPFQQAIPVAKMPATYIDALRITRSIGVRYLWIDSLCILQDSLDDWAQEASAMASVYENTYCNIAAAAAKDSRDGCYATRNPFTFAPCRISTTTDNRELYAHLYWFEGTLEQLERRSESGLFSRAWILQELLLSPRVLYFGPKGLCFACKKLRASERNVNGEVHSFSPPLLLPLYRKSAASTALRSFQWATQNMIPDSQFPHNLHSVWFDIVSRYSELALSVAGDKLVALAGVAERIIAARSSGDEYLAGLWRSTFLSDLLWYPNNRRARPQLSLEFRAPTWSWASAEGKV
ncbi:heterokaryon incompatibility protein-domain-containing protein, partial [Apodospora peruviana]